MKTLSIAALAVTLVVLNTAVAFCQDESGDAPDVFARLPVKEGLSKSATG